jgi:hypothetical protein
MYSVQKYTTSDMVKDALQCIVLGVGVFLGLFGVLACIFGVWFI